MHMDHSFQEVLIGGQSWIHRGEQCWQQSWRTTHASLPCGPCLPTWLALTSSSLGESRHSNSALILGFKHQKYLVFFLLVVQKAWKLIMAYKLICYIYIHSNILTQYYNSCTWYDTRYVSRVHPKDSGKHVILGVQQFKPAEFAQQINLNMENCWGILRFRCFFFCFECLTFEAWFLFELLSASLVVVNMMQCK